MKKLILFLAVLAMPFAFAQDVTTPSNLAYAGTFNKCFPNKIINPIPAGHVLKVERSLGYAYRVTGLDSYTSTPAPILFGTSIYDYTSLNANSSGAGEAPTWIRASPNLFMGSEAGTNGVHSYSSCVYGLLFKEIPIVTQ